MEHQLANNSTDNCIGNFSNSSACSGDSGEIDLPKAVSLLLIFVLSLVGNVCTIAIVSRFKTRTLPDILVISLACNDLIATIIPVTMTLYSYFTLRQFEENGAACDFYGTIAQFTRYASAFIVTLISVERYLAVNRPFIYRKHATPFKCTVFLLCGCLVAFVLAIAPVLDKNTSIISHDGFCLFDYSSTYANSIIVYGGVQFAVVLVCFVLVTTNLIKVYRRKKKMKVQANLGQRGQTQERDPEGGLKFTRPKLTSRCVHTPIHVSPTPCMIFIITQKEQYEIMVISSLLGSVAFSLKLLQ